MYPYLLEFTISRHFLSQPARNSRLLHLRFRGNTRVLVLAPPHRIKAYVGFCWNAAELPAVSFFEARVL